MDAISLRRSKTDKMENGEPLLKLPSKTVVIREVRFSENEKLCYDTYLQKVQTIVAR